MPTADDTFVNNSDLMNNSSFVNNSDLVSDDDAPGPDQENGPNGSDDPDGSDGSEDVTDFMDVEPTGDPELDPVEPEVLEKQPKVSKNEPHVSEEELQVPGELQDDRHEPSAPTSRSQISQHQNPQPQRPTVESAQNQKSTVESAQSQKPTVETQPQRLVITKLVLTDFKLYAGVQEIGPFNASFSAVVGPNGSGKLNVIDLMLFVFGFRASKMRQGKLSELIHNSGGDPIDHCQVDIHFQHVIDTPHGAEVVPGLQIVIGRRAFRSNGSQYFINGRNSTYTSVTGYLRGQGIDLDHKRFLILQGEVELIAQMKPKAEKDNDDGLLEYLEDIIGTTHYKLKIDASAASIDDLNQVCTEKEHRFVLVEQDTAGMEDKKDEALRFLAAEKNLAQKRSLKYQARLLSSNKTLAATEALVAEVLEKLQAEHAKNDAFSKEIDAAHSEKARLKAELDALAAKLSAAARRQKAINSQTVQLEEKAKNSEAKIKKIRKARASAEQALAAATIKHENMAASEAQYQHELAGLEKALEMEKTVLHDLRQKLTQKTAHFAAEISTLQAKLEPFNDKVKAREGDIELLKSEIAIFEAQKNAINDKLRAASERLVDIKAEGKAKEAELVQNEHKLAHIDEQIVLGEEQIAGARKNLEAKKVRLAAARLKTQDAASTLVQAQNKNQVLANLYRLSKSGRITGFHGRLGDLGVIDDKYDVAISTACSALDSMVVETVETAQTCIEYLRRNKLGYATFICLDKLRKFNMNPINVPGNPMTVKRLFDLITPKDKMFLPAFYSKLRDTLVAPNLAEAKSVAYGPTRFKVVTLDGKLVDTSGTMSGGGLYLARGGMKLRSNAISRESDYTEDDIHQMQEELALMETTVDKLAGECHQMDTNLRKLKELKPETEFAIQTAQLDIQALVAEKKEISASCKALYAEKEKAEASLEADLQIKRKYQALEQAVKARDELKLQMLESETRIILLEENIMEAGGVQLKVQNSKVDSLKQQIEIVNEKSSTDRVTLKKLENDVKRYLKIIADGEGEMQAAEAEIKVLEEELELKRVARDEVQQEVKKMEDSISERESELEAINDNLEELTAKINELKSEEIELRNQLEKLQGTVKRCRRDIADAEEGLSACVVRDSSPLLQWMSDEERAPYNTSDLQRLSEEELAKTDMGTVEQEILDLERYMADVKVDVEILKEYGLKQQELTRRRDELNEAVREREDLQNHWEELKRKRLDEFMEGFNTISLLLKEMYQMITMGGNAELELVDSLDPFSEGILFSVMPPKKSWKNISNLSGGEKTLSSLALVFALHKYKPTPLYVMDEIDAALDFRNVSIVANYIKERTKNGQFIVISLRNNMFELAQQLVGIYKVRNMTRSISLQNQELFQKAVETK